MAELFERDKSVISRHIKNVFDEGELRREAVVAEFATTASDGKTYQVEHFNLDVIISVGYRVKSRWGTQFRIWATKTVREYIKGFVLDDERLKQGKAAFGKDYFVLTPLELLARLAAILPAPRFALRREIGLFAPGAKLRRKVVPTPPSPLGPVRPAAPCRPLAGNASLTLARLDSPSPSRPGLR